MLGLELEDSGFDERGSCGRRRVGDVLRALRTDLFGVARERDRPLFSSDRGTVLDRVRGSVVLGRDGRACVAR